MSQIDWRTDSGAELWWLSHAASFEFRLQYDERACNDVVFKIETRGHDRWAVVLHGSVLDKKANDFVYEPLNSNRTEAFFRRARFASKEEALKALQRFVATHEILPAGYRRKPNSSKRAKTQ